MFRTVNSAITVHSCLQTADSTRIRQRKSWCAIADSSAKSYRALVGEKPVIAMLSHSTKGSAHHTLVDKVVKATEIAHEKYPQLDLDGELRAMPLSFRKLLKSKAKRQRSCRSYKRSDFPEPGLRKYRIQSWYRDLQRREAYGPIFTGYCKTG